mmetsp:Transcript_42718/g.76721  ORF Transcript_42718/g.76721 Transcript_42718/m.76721 type:complete len:91 (+) Transcript_42718:180-452(+)
MPSEVDWVECQGGRVLGEEGKQWQRQAGPHFTRWSGQACYPHHWAKSFMGLLIDLATFPDRIRADWNPQWAPELTSSAILLMVDPACMLQ